MKLNLCLLFVFLRVFTPFSINASEQNGRSVYLNRCASCHHAERIGLSAPPLIPETLDKLTDEKMTKIISKGLPNTLMPSHADLKPEEIADVISFLRTKNIFKWNDKKINESIVQYKKLSAPLPYKDVLNLTAVVERGASKVWLMENDQVLDKFNFSDVHGGIKYSRDYSRFFVPARDGHIGKYIVNKGYDSRVRACISLRNITVSNDNKYLIASCLYPQQMVVLNQSDLKVKKIIGLKGKVSGLYTLNNVNSGIFTFRDSSQIGYFDFNKLNISYKKLNETIEDFFIDPLDKFIIGSSRNGDYISVIDLKNQKTIFEKASSGMPHLSSASYWYDKGEFYFATFHIKSNFISVWKMYKWDFVKNIEVGGNGFFVRSHPGAPQLWIDNGSDELVLVDKKSLEVTKMKPYPGKKFTHTEFSKDGSLAYLSIFDKEGSLILYDTATLKELKRFDINLPVGKYNVVNKEREFLPVNLGQSVFMGKCWGCHHQESMAFGPSFKKIASMRSKEMIRTHLDGPRANAINLGYKNPTMPDIPLSEEEKDMLVAYIVSLKVKLLPLTLYNMAEHSLKHPERIARDCESYKQWKNLGFDAFTEKDKEIEKNYIQLCY